MSIDRKAVLIALGVALGAFLIGYAISALSFAATSSPSDVVMVPDVRTMQLDQALQEMDRAGLEAEVGDSFPNVQMPAGAVLAQSPLPGEEVSPGVAVRLIVSTGRPRPEVPEVEAMPLSLATRALQTAGFDVLVEQDSAPGELGRVVGVDPPAGTPLELPATVRLMVGGGYEIIEMPTLIGMREETALETIEDLGLLVGEVDYQESDFGEPGGVVDQLPLPGDSVATGTPVDLRVNGPERDGRIRGTLGRITDPSSESGRER